jgi:hypothetical protein
MISPLTDGSGRGCGNHDKEVKAYAHNQEQTEKHDVPSDIDYFHRMAPNLRFLSSGAERFPFGMRRA